VVGTTNTCHMKFEEHLKDSERFLSSNFHYSKDDAGENALRSVVEQFIASAEKLDQYKKHKYYGRALPPELANEKVQMTVQGFERSDDGMEKVLHAIVGLSTECGELMEAIYKAKWSGQKFDEVNCKEELGDLFWYMAIIFREYGFSLEDVLQRNADKLNLRYGAKFSEDKAINRDLTAERKVLENGDEQ
jgi:NTP pyrophosphatase (non-canonical NTP hydrolase)